MSYTRSSIPDLTGRTAVITGANGGLGLETAKALAAKRAHVAMAVRDAAKAERAVAEIRAETPEASLELVPLDLAYVRADRTVAEVHDLVPHDETPVFSGGPVLYALEVPAGTLAANALGPGDVLTLP